MKKQFLVTIAYSESKPEHVLYDTAIEITLENMMEGYVATNSIDKEYLVNVSEIK